MNWPAALAALSLGAGGCAHSGAPPSRDDPPTHDAPPGRPLVQAPEEVEPVAALMREMQAEADEAIRRAAEGDGPLAERHRLAWLDIAGAMRPRFGPANAWLFQERDQKHRALAERLGAKTVLPSGVDPDEVEAFLARVDALAAALATGGRKVASRRAGTAPLQWSPPAWGRALRVAEAWRTVPKRAPYGQPGEGDSAAAQSVVPAFTVFLFPPARLVARENLVAREQPGVLLGAVDGALVFALPPQHSPDSDDGRTEAAVLEVLFGKAKALDAPGLVATLGVQSARLHRGLLRIEADGDPRPLNDVALPRGALAVLWTRVDGAHAERTAWWVGPKP